MHLDWVISPELVCFVHQILVKVVVVGLRFVWGLESLLTKGLPVVIPQPDVLLDFGRSV